MSELATWRWIDEVYGLVGRRDVFPSVCHRHRFMRALFTITKVCVRVCCVSLAHLVLDCGEKHMV